MQMHAPSFLVVLKDFHSFVMLPSHTNFDGKEKAQRVHFLKMQLVAAAESLLAALSIGETY
jgi:hypothetical protein